MLSDYMKKTQSTSRIKGDLFDVSVSNQVTALYSLANGYATKKGGEPPIPQEITVRKLPKKSAVRCNFPTTLDIATLTNAAIDLSLQSKISIDGSGDKLVIDIH